MAIGIHLLEAVIFFFWLSEAGNKRSIHPTYFISLLVKVATLMTYFRCYSETGEPDSVYLRIVMICSSLKLSCRSPCVKDTININYYHSKFPGKSSSNSSIPKKLTVAQYPSSIITQHTLLKNWRSCASFHKIHEITNLINEHTPHQL